MKANIGIRRRLAPLLDNDRNQLELFTALLLSLPGSPVLYYGDEIGMGDNIWLGDRDGVRTPMQWSPGPQRRVLPPATRPGCTCRSIMDPVYGYQAVNVEAQMNSTASLLHWTRRMIEIRKRHPAFGLGEFTRPRRLEPDGAVVHAAPRRRRRRRDTVLCVNNLSRFPQPVELDLRGLQGGVPDRADRRRAVPADRRTALPADAAGSRLLLVRHHARGTGPEAVRSRRPGQIRRGDAVGAPAADPAAGRCGT